MTKVKERPKKKANKKRSEKSNKINKIRQHIVQVTLLSLIIFAVIFCTYQIIKLAIIVNKLTEYKNSDNNWVFKVTDKGLFENTFKDIANLFK